MQTMFLELSLNVGAFLTESILADRHPGETMFFLSGVYQEFGAKTMEIKVKKINARCN